MDDDPDGTETIVESGGELEAKSLPENWPIAHFGTFGNTHVDWKPDPNEEFDPDDDEEAPTDPDVVAMLGFDPKELSSGLEDPDDDEDPDDEDEPDDENETASIKNIFDKLQKRKANA